MRELNLKIFIKCLKYMLLFSYFWFIFIQMTFLSYFFILTTLLGTIFIYVWKTGDAIRSKHQNRHCYTESTYEYYNIIADQR